MNNADKKLLTRRKFIGAAGILTTGLVSSSSPLFSAPAILKSLGKPNSLINGVQIGCITYSFRSMPDQSAEATLQYVLDAGISAIELMGEPAESFAGAPENPVDMRTLYGLKRKARSGVAMSDEEKSTLANMDSQNQIFSEYLAEWRKNVSMDSYVYLRKMYNDAGVQIYGFKPRAFEKNNTDAEIDYGFRAAKALGASHVTLEHPSDDAWTKKLGDIATKHKIYVGYHGHEQQTPTLWDTALQQSKYNALNLDVGHYVAAGNPSPLDLLRVKHQNIVSMHVKDRQTPEHGKANLAFGQGDTPIIEVLQLMRDQKYKFPASIELEYEIPSGSDAVKEVAKCLAYCKKALEV